MAGSLLNYTTKVEAAQTAGRQTFFEAFVEQQLALPPGGGK